MATNGAVTNDQQPSVPAANPGQEAAAAATVAVAATTSVSPSEVGEPGASQPQTPTAQSLPAATVTAPSVPSSSAAPVTTGAPTPVPTVTQPTFAELEDNITKRIMDAMTARFATMAIPQQASQPTQRQSSSQQQNETTTTEDQDNQSQNPPDPWADWHARGWQGWNWNENNEEGNDWNQGWWKRNDDERDRPYLSHLVFPTFDGKRQEYSTYKYDVMNLKSQCSEKRS